MSVASRIIAICVPALLVLNPVVVGIFLELNIIRIIYILVFDFFLIMISVLCIVHFNTKNRRYLILSLTCIASLPFLMLFTEIGLTYSRFLLSSPWKDTIENVHRTDPNLGWALLPNSFGRHALPNSYDVRYHVDGDGRRKISHDDSANQTLHFFGDSFVFGQGVANHETALALLRENIESNILNNGVMGYGLEQMFISLRSRLDDIDEGDVVVFAPISTDLRRNFIYKEQYCRFLFFDVDGYKVKLLPRNEKNNWSYLSIEENCGIRDVLYYAKGLPFGKLFEKYKMWSTLGAVIENADQIFTQARQLVQEKGGEFVVVFLTTPVECRRREFDVNLTDLNTPYLSLMPYCPTDDKLLDKLQLSGDSHWSVFGNEWAANALEHLLRTELASL